MSFYMIGRYGTRKEDELPSLILTENSTGRSGQSGLFRFLDTSVHFCVHYVEHRDSGIEIAQEMHFSKSVLATHSIWMGR
ncbi:MAG: hypothetical protein GY696_21735 [Gammaproteobacteria bacterium]|nr:hypothetical protein [Gammaproteobacteria bacterium]